MNKIWVVAGIIFLSVVILGAWLFVGNYGSFSLFLGKTSKEAAQDEPLRFIGTWSAPGGESLTFISTTQYKKTGEQGSWSLTNDTISLFKRDEGSPWAIYHYEFSEKDTILQLTTVVSAETVVFTRQ